MLHKHSTLFGVLTTALVAALLGYFARWSPPVLGGAIAGGILLFPRLFYGWAASRALDESVKTRDSLGAVGRFSSRDMSGLDDNSYRLQQAYDQLQAATSGGYDATGKLADPNALAKFAEEEQRDS